MLKLGHIMVYNRKNSGGGCAMQRQDDVKTENKLKFHVFQDERFVDLNLYQYGWERTDPLHSYGPHKRDHYLFHYVITGSGTLYANFTPFKGFTFTSRLGYRESNDNYYQYDNLFYGSSSVLNQDQNGAQRSNTSVTYYQWENFANYSTTIAQDHNLSAI